MTNVIKLGRKINKEFTNVTEIVAFYKSEKEAVKASTGADVGVAGAIGKKFGGKNLQLLEAADILQQAAIDKFKDETSKKLFKALFESKGLIGDQIAANIASAIIPSYDGMEVLEKKSVVSEIRNNYNKESAKFQAGESIGKIVKISTSVPEGAKLCFSSEETSAYKQIKEAAYENGEHMDLYNMTADSEEKEEAVKALLSKNSVRFGEEKMFIGKPGDITTAIRILSLQEKLDSDITLTGKGGKKLSGNTLDDLKSIIEEIRFDILKDIISKTGAKRNGIKIPGGIFATALSCFGNKLIIGKNIAEKKNWKNGEYVVLHKDPVQKIAVVVQLLISNEEVDIIRIPVGVALFLGNLDFDGDQVAIYKPKMPQAKLKPLAWTGEEFKSVFKSDIEKATALYALERLNANSRNSGGGVLNLGKSRADEVALAISEGVGQSVQEDKALFLDGFTLETAKASFLKEAKKDAELRLDMTLIAEMAIRKIEPEEFEPLEFVFPEGALMNAAESARNVLLHTLGVEIIDMAVTFEEVEKGNKKFPANVLHWRGSRTIGGIKSKYYFSTPFVMDGILKEGGHDYCISKIVETDGKSSTMLSQFDYWVELLLSSTEARKAASECKNMTARNKIAAAMISEAIDGGSPATWINPELSKFSRNLLAEQVMFRIDATKKVTLYNKEMDVVPDCNEFLNYVDRFSTAKSSETKAVLSAAYLMGKNGPARNRKVSNTMEAAVYSLNKFVFEPTYHLTEGKRTWEGVLATLRTLVNKQPGRFPNPIFTDLGGVEKQNKLNKSIRSVAKTALFLVKDFNQGDFLGCQPGFGDARTVSKDFNLDLLRLSPKGDEVRKLIEVKSTIGDKLVGPLGEKGIYNAVMGEQLYALIDCESKAQALNLIGNLLSILGKKAALIGEKSVCVAIDVTAGNTGRNNLYAREILSAVKWDYALNNTQFEGTREGFKAKEEEYSSINQTVSVFKGPQGSSPEEVANFIFLGHGVLLLEDVINQQDKGMERDDHDKVINAGYTQLLNSYKNTLKPVYDSIIENYSNDKFHAAMYNAGIGFIPAQEFDIENRDSQLSGIAAARAARKAIAETTTTNFKKVVAKCNF